LADGERSEVMVSQAVALASCPYCAALRSAYSASERAALDQLRSVIGDRYGR